MINAQYESQPNLTPAQLGVARAKALEILETNNVYLDSHPHIVSERIIATVIDALLTDFKPE